MRGGGFRVVSLFLYVGDRFFVAGPPAVKEEGRSELLGYLALGPCRMYVCIMIEGS